MSIATTGTFDLGLSTDVNAQKILQQQGLVSLPVIMAGFLTYGLAMFVALLWQDAFQRMLKKYDQTHGGNSEKRAFLSAAIVTVLATLMAFGIARFLHWYTAHAAKIRFINN